MRSTRQQFFRSLACFLLALTALSTEVSSFGIPELHTAQMAWEASASSITAPAQLLVDQYQHALETDALKTQIVTGITLAIVGDAIGQRAASASDDSDEFVYDTKRAASFATFDGCYRMVQHYLYPPLIALCHGDILGPALAEVSHTANAQHLAAAMEQSLISQLLVIPLLYYPVFFAITGAVQGLTARQTMTRAQTSFWPLTTRNWLFWIPVQFGVFGFCDSQDLQISILIVCGLVWTVILSVLAGAAKEQPQPQTVRVQEIFPEDGMVVDLPAVLPKAAVGVADSSTTELFEVAERNVLTSTRTR